MQVVVKDVEVVGLYLLFVLGQSQGYLGGGMIGNLGVLGVGVGGGMLFGIMFGLFGWDLLFVLSGSGYVEGQFCVLGVVVVFQGFVQVVKEVQESRVVDVERFFLMKEREVNICLWEVQICCMEMEIVEILGVLGCGVECNVQNGVWLVYGVKVEQLSFVDQLKLYYGDLYVEFCGFMVGVRDDLKYNWWEVCRKVFDFRQLFLKVIIVIQNVIRCIEESG